jgi:hypothetical protein
MNRVNRVRAGVACVAIAAGAVGVGAASSGAASAAKHTSGKFYIAETPQKKAGILYLAGQGTDKALGSDAITFTIKPLPNSSGTITAKAISVTLWTKTGTLTGTGSATLTITNQPATGDATASNGTVSLTKGTGTLAGHAFNVKFTGPGNVSTGLYTFSYTGTYK